jgi:hypothetical protein
MPRLCAARRRIVSMAESPPLSTSANCCRSTVASVGGLVRSESTYARYALFVGTRPADVCGWKRKPFSSRSLIVFLMVAGDTPKPKRRDSVRDPAGSAVWM